MDAHLGKDNIQSKISRLSWIAVKKFPHTVSMDKKTDRRMERWKEIL